MLYVALRRLPSSEPWLAVVASALWLALCLCCPPSACRVAAALLAAAVGSTGLCCTAAGLLGCSASGLCCLAVVDLCAACTSRALSALGVSDGRRTAWLSAESAGLGLGIGGEGIGEWVVVDWEGQVGRAGR